MAKPIQPTPILEGKDAERLWNEVDDSRYDANKQKFLDDCKAVYNKIQKNK